MSGAECVLCPRTQVGSHNCKSFLCLKACCQSWVKFLSCFSLCVALSSSWCVADMALALLFPFYNTICIIHGPLGKICTVEGNVRKMSFQDSHDVWSPPPLAQLTSFCCVSDEGTAGLKHSEGPGDWSRRGHRLSVPHPPWDGQCFTTQTRGRELPASSLFPINKGRWVMVRGPTELKVVPFLLVIPDLN